MKIKPNYDVAITVQDDTLVVEFAGIPELEQVAEIMEMEKSRGVVVDSGQSKRQLDLVEDSCSSVTPKLELQRLLYFLHVSPVYEIMQVGNLLGRRFKDGHGLSVKVIDARYRGGDPSLVKVFK